MYYVLMTLSLLDGEKIRVAMALDAVVMQSLRDPEWDESPEWRTVYAESKTDAGLSRCLERASMYAMMKQKSLAKKAFDSVA